MTAKITQAEWPRPIVSTTRGYDFRITHSGKPRTLAGLTLDDGE